MRAYNPGLYRDWPKKPCARCRLERRLAYCNTPGKWYKQNLCAVCQENLESHLRSTQEERRSARAAALGPEMMRNIVAKDIAELYGDD